MIEKILIVNANKVVVYFTTRPPLTVHDSNGAAYLTALWLLSATKLKTEEYKTAYISQTEDTCLSINLKIA